MIISDAQESYVQDAMRLARDGRKMAEAKQDSSMTDFFQSILDELRYVTRIPSQEWLK